MWYIETTAIQEEGRPYELIEEFIERGIEQGQFHTSQELATFYGLDTKLVQKVLAFLETIGHVTCGNNQWYLTERGQRSLQKGTRYIPKQASYKLYFDGFRSKPLLRDHYGKGLQILSHQEAERITRYSKGGYQFHRLFSLELWDKTTIRKLEYHPEKQRYNLPSEAHNLSTAEPVRVYMPMYIIETEKQTRGGSTPYYIAYTHIKGRRDDYFEEMVNTYQEIKRALYAEYPVQESNFWREWLADQGLSPVPPIQLTKGMWQVVLDKEVFRSSRTRFVSEDVGNFHLEHGYFIQIWCNDPIIRRDAALDRTLRIIEKMQKRITRQDIVEHLQRFASQLDTRELLLEDVRKRAEERRMKELLNLIVAL